MITITVPGRGEYRLAHAVFDVNGTLALDGHLLEGVVEGLAALRQHLEVHLLTADTHGRQAAIDAQLGLTARRIGGAEGKAAFVRALGADTVVAIGNGANDAAMLEAAALGIVILGPEGLAADALRQADILVPDIGTALGLLLHPRRLVATLRR
ncbi:MAG: HAD family hydrolase [Chloroflexi bacterium]|nr:MAG: HAD family hydrolase [Chloroflexota bacterium]